MSEQRVDTEALRSLTEQLTALVGYTEALRSSAGGFAYMLPAEWQGPASQQFLATFELWAMSAAALRDQTEALQQLAGASLQAYEGTITALDETWAQLQGSL
jgi:uncharacterized protein YukE